MSQQCRPDPQQHVWCAIAISNGAQVRILDIYVAADARHAGRRRLEMSFTGDLNGDGVFDVMFGWDCGGSVSCTAEYLFVSLETPGGWRWPMAGDSACD